MNSIKNHQPLLPAESLEEPACADRDSASFHLCHYFYESFDRRLIGKKKIL
ncbi:MAG: hypothetical protein LW842_04360 [Sphingobacteriales bacterium]|nr:hypothetical protein [Sphingobacteriales bacterium]